ncbi:MAG TPA: helix-turn-helix transcriptional regulator [Pseudonocardiaceae bacterium]|nr:helix-turn-helix transcriptional regulator [Pseudonocardiaceae bacterium]
MVTLQRLAQAVRLVDQVGGLDDPTEFPAVVLPGLAGLIGCDVVTYNEIGTSPRAVRYRDFPTQSLAPETRRVFARYVHEHPLVNYYRRTGDPRPMKISDLLDRKRFHALSLYAEFFAKRPVEHQLAMTVADRRSIVVGFAFSRSTCDFTEADREVLGVLRGPLLTGLLRCRSRYRARLTLDLPDPDRLAELTDREVYILELVATGRTNQAIAHALQISPRTVAKHLEHAYRKLNVSSRASAATLVASGSVR